jgi:uncharacterized protein YbjT (DUF2867 family)
MSSRESTRRTIVVTGATGKQGGAAARQLLKKEFRVRAVTRDPDTPAARRLSHLGMDVVRGDLDDAASLRPALQGAYGVFSVQNFWETGYEREVQQGVSLANLVRAAGVKHFVYSSVGSAHRHTGLPHFESKWEIEQHIRSSGVPYTILRPVFFMENWETPSLRSAILGGTLAGPLDPSRPLQQVAVADVGAFVALAFDKREQWLGRELDLAGDELTMPQVAETFSRVLGRPVESVRIPWDQFRDAAGEEYTRMFQWFDRVGYEADIGALRSIHPQLTRLEDYLRGHNWADAAQFAGA